MSASNLTADPSSRFHRIRLEGEELEQATNVSPYFLAYLQNKIEAYASELVTTSLPYTADPQQQVKAILEHERLRNFVAAYEELFAELTVPTANN